MKVFADARRGEDARVGAGLGEAQRRVVDFLLEGASEALPLTALVEHVLDLPGLTMAEATDLIEHLGHPTRGGGGAGSGLDAALAVLGAAVG